MAENEKQRNQEEISWKRNDMKRNENEGKAKAAAARRGEMAIMWRGSWKWQRSWSVSNRRNEEAISEMKESGYPWGRNMSSAYVENNQHRSGGKAYQRGGQMSGESNEAWAKRVEISRLKWSERQNIESWRRRTAAGKWRKSAKLIMADGARKHKRA